MKDRVTLTCTSLLSIVLFSLHWADEVARGMEPGTTAGVGGLLILFVWLYATLAIGHRRSGLVLLLLASSLAAVVPILHMQGAGMVGGHIAPNSSGALFWVWTLIALGASGMLSVALTVRRLWSLGRAQAASGTAPE
jgi:hypothetical protein